MEALREMDFAVRLIKKVTRPLAGKTGITLDDLPDLRQDILLDLLERLPGYRPERGHIRAFISRVINNKVADMLKARSAARRGGGTPSLSLNWEFENEDGETVEFHESLSVDGYLRRTRGTLRSEEERRDLALDVRKMVDRLPPPQRVVCMLLVDASVCDIANVVGVPRSTLRDLITRLRVICEDAGLEKYFR